MISIATQKNRPHRPSSLPAASKSMIFRSRLPDIPIDSRVTLHDYCFARLAEFANNPCLIFGPTGGTHTFAETHLLCRRVAAGLAALGIRRGDAVLLLLQNCPQFVFVFLGASMIGAVASAANPFSTPAEIRKQFVSSGAKLAVTQSAYADKLCCWDELCGGRIVVVDSDDRPADDCLPFSVLSGADEVGVPEVDVRPGDTVALPFSSGTTGLPKGVELTHRSLVASISQQVDGENPNMYLKSGEDVVLCVLPLFHIFSLNSVLLCALRAGAAVLMMPKFEMEAMLGLIQKYKVTAAAVVPPLVLALAKNPAVDNYDLTSIRFIISGAAPLGKELEAALRRRLPHAVLGQGYGMTEAGPVLSMCPAFAKWPTSAKSGSCGTIVRNAELKVIDPETGFSLKRIEAGEICIRGPQIMKATSATIDVEGWLHTGDIGYVDDDDEVYIVDRVKELIKFKGFQVPPAELEALLISHPCVVDAAVVPQKDEAAGEVPVAFVVRSAGVELSEDEVKEFIGKQVIFYKRLHKVYFVHSIPKSPAGKILRKELRSKLANAADT